MADSSVCHFNQRKRSHHGTMEDAPRNEAKRLRTMLPGLNFNAASESQYMNQPSGETVRSPAQRQGIIFSLVDYNTPTTVFETPPVSPKSFGDPMSAINETSSTVEKQPEPTSSMNNQLPTPAMTDVPSGPSDSMSLFSFPDRLSPTQSFQDSFAPQSFGPFPVFEPPTAANPNAAEFGPFLQTDTCQHQVAFHHHQHCHCVACHFCFSHAFANSRHSSGGWRRTSSLTLPLCFRDHSHQHNVFTAPQTAPLPVAPLDWNSGMYHQQAQMTPPFPSSAWSHSTQTTPTFSPELPGVTNPRFEESPWTNNLGFHGRDPLVVPSSSQENINSEAPGNVPSADRFPELFDLDRMMSDYGTF